MEELSPQTTVSYTVREVLDEQTKLLRGIDSKVDGKADKSDVTNLAQKIDGHGDRILTLENWRTTNTRFFAGAGVLGMIAATVVGSLVAAHVI